MRQWFNGMSTQRVIDSHRYVAAGFPLYAAGIYNGNGTTAASGLNAGQAYHAHTYSNAVYPHSGGGSFETEGLYKPHSINGLIDRENMEARTCDRCRNKYRNQAALDRHRPTCVIPIDLSDDDDVIVDDSSNSQGTAPEGPASKRPEYEHEVIMISDDEDDSNARITSSAFGNSRTESNNGFNGNGAAAGGRQLEGLAAGIYETVTNGKLVSDKFVGQSQVFNTTSNSVNGSGMSSAKVLSCNSGQPSTGTLSSDNYRPIHCFQPVPLTQSAPSSGLPAFVASSTTFGAALLRTENSRLDFTSTVSNSIAKRDDIYLNGSSHNSIVPAARNQHQLGTYGSQVQHLGSLQPYNGVSRDFIPNSNSLRSPASSYQASQASPAEVNRMMPGKSLMTGNTTEETITLEDASGKVNRISVATVPTVVINTASSARSYSLTTPSTPSVQIALKQGSWQYPAFPTYITPSVNNSVNPVLAGNRPAPSYLLQPSVYSSGSVLQQPFSTSVIGGPNGYRYETQMQAWNTQPSSSLTIANGSYPQILSSAPQVPMPYPGYVSQSPAYYGSQQSNFPGRVPSSSYICVNNNAISQGLPQIDLSTSFKQQQLTQVQRGFVLQNGAQDQYTGGTLPVISSQQVPVIQYGYRSGLPQFDPNGEMCNKTSTCICARCLKNNMAARINEEMKKSALEATTTRANPATSSHGIKRRMVDILPKPAKMFKCGNTLQLAKPPPKVIPETSDADSGYSDTSYSSKSSPQNNGSLGYQSSLTSHSPGPLQSLSRQLDRISNCASHVEFKPRESAKVKKAKTVIHDSRKALGLLEVANSIPLGTKKPLKEKPKSIAPKQKRSPPPKMTSQQVKLTVKNKDGKNLYSIRDAKKNNSENLSAMKCLKVKAVKSATKGNRCSDVVVVPSIHVVPVPTVSNENLTIDEEADINGLKQEGDAVNQTHQCVIVYDVKVGAEIVFRSSDVRSVWDHVFFHVQGSISKRYLPPLRYPPTSVQLSNMKSDVSTAGIDAVKIIHQAVQFLLQDLPKPEKKASKKDLRLKKKPKKKLKQQDDEASALKQSCDDTLGSEDDDCVRIRLFERIKKFDMFGWLANPARRTKDVDLWTPIKKSAEKEIKRSGTLQYRNNSRALRKNASGWDLCVLPSFIQGRGLFARKEIPENEIVIEYAGEIIRPILCDRREKLYESKGYGCYMFKIDDDEVVDATMRGNAARFINHSCEPNCKSKIVEVNGRKRIFIFTLRKITPQEELTYDYCFAKESRDKKLACTCGAPRCRKFLN